MQKKVKHVDNLIDYKALRQQNKKLFRQLEKQFDLDTLYVEPLCIGESKPFYMVTRQKTGKTESGDSSFDFRDMPL